MLQSGDDPGLALEPAHPLGVEGDLPGEDLHRHVAVEAGIPGAADLHHPART